jgi:hypothetical protein
MGTLARMPEVAWGICCGYMDLALDKQGASYEQIARALSERSWKDASLREADCLRREPWRAPSESPGIRTRRVRVALRRTACNRSRWIGDAGRQSWRRASQAIPQASTNISIRRSNANARAREHLGGYLRYSRSLHVRARELEVLSEARGVHLIRPIHRSTPLCHSTRGRTP